MKRNTIDIITLGCSKNLVDSEKLMRQLEANGYKDRKSTRLNSSHNNQSRMPSSA